jgi:hypothetical protein
MGEVGISFFLSYVLTAVPKAKEVFLNLSYNQVISPPKNAQLD